MYYQFPEGYFFPVVKKGDLDFLDAGYRQEEMAGDPKNIAINEDEVQVNEEDIERKDEEVFQEVDEEYVEAEVEQHMTSDMI